MTTLKIKSFQPIISKDISTLEYVFNRTIISFVTCGICIVKVNKVKLVPHSWVCKGLRLPLHSLTSYPTMTGACIWYISNGFEDTSEGKTLHKCNYNICNVLLSHSSSRTNCIWTK